MSLTIIRRQHLSLAVTGILPLALGATIPLPASA